jgi:hypothetical protein
MLASILISAVSFVLLVYWFRYSCILLLRSLESPVVEVKGDLDPLRRAVERDFSVLTYLWRHAADLREQSLEERILMLDFKLLMLWYRFTRTALPGQARRALSEMGAVVSFLGQKLSEQAGLTPASRPANLL